MKIQEMKSEYRIQEMKKVIRACTESGLTVSEWCQENNFSEGSYYYWLKKIREKTIEEVETGNEIVQVPIMLQKTAERKKSRSGSNIRTWSWKFPAVWAQKISWQYYERSNHAEAA